MIGFVVTMHKSRFRPNGFELINRFMRTLYRTCKKEFILYLFDNQSVEKYDVPDYPNLVYEYVENQMKRGLAGTYNDGTNKALKDGCDIIVIANDDVIFNKTINIFFDIMVKDKYKDISMYGPLSSGCVKGAPQYAEKVGKGTLEITNWVKPIGILRGFLFAFTKEFYEFVKTNQNLLINETEFLKWRGGEKDILKRIKKRGGKTLVIKNCWLFHHGLGGPRKRFWKKRGK